MNSEFYPRPVFHVRDVAASVAYYCEKLGFSKNWGEDSEPIIAQVGRGDLEIILESEAAMPTAAVPSVLSATLRENRLDALHEELRDLGAKIRREPFDVSWDDGVRQFEVEDLAGNVLVFWGENPG